MKIIFFIFMSFNFLIADVNIDSNLNVLKALDIKDSFIENKSLKKSYLYYYRYKKKYFINALNNGIDIYPIIKFEIEKSSLPKELISVVLAESLMNVKAKSDKKAVGLWQFIPSTARKYGLRIDDYVDERRDIYKSTKAAIKYLDYLHNFFGKWYLAIMAYNAGEARVVEGVVRAKVDKICKKLGKKCKYNKKIKEYRKIIKNYQHYGPKKFNPLYKLYKKLSNVKITLNDLLRYQKHLKRQYIPKETREYILKVLSISFLFNNQKLLEYSKKQILKGIEKPTFVSVKVPEGTSLLYVSKILNMDYKTLRNHNLQLKYSFTPPYKYYINIPANKLALFNMRFKPNKRKYVYIYKVKKGDTLLKIAKRFDTKVSILESFNKLGKYLHINQKIFIPLDYKFVKYKVRKGDSLLKIAEKFGISYKKIKKFNNLNSNLIRVGQILKIPQRI